MNMIISRLGSRFDSTHRHRALDPQLERVSDNRPTQVVHRCATY